MVNKKILKTFAFISKYFFSYNFDVYFIFALIVLRASSGIWWITSISYGSRDKLNRNRPKNAKFQNLYLFIFHPILIQFFYPLNGLLMGHKTISKGL